MVYILSGIVFFGDYIYMNIALSICFLIIPFLLKKPNFKFYLYSFLIPFIIGIAINVIILLAKSHPLSNLNLYALFFIAFSLLSYYLGKFVKEKGFNL